MEGDCHIQYVGSSVISPQVGGGSAAEGVEVALDPSELDLDAATMTARWVWPPYQVPSLSLSLWVVTFELLKVTTQIGRARGPGRRLGSPVLHHQLLTL